MIVTERWMFKPPCARMRATWPNGGWGCIVLAVICWAPSAQGALLPDRALYLPTFSHFLIVNKTSLPPPPSSLSSSHTQMTSNSTMYVLQPPTANRANRHRL